MSSLSYNDFIEKDFGPSIKVGEKYVTTDLTFNPILASFISTWREMQCKEFGYEFIYKPEFIDWISNFLSQRVGHYIPFRQFILFPKCITERIS